MSIVNQLQSWSTSSREQKIHGLELRVSFDQHCNLYFQNLIFLVVVSLVKAIFLVMDGEDPVARICCSVLVLAITFRIRVWRNRVGPVCHVVCVSELVGLCICLFSQCCNYHQIYNKLCAEVCTDGHLLWQTDLGLWDTGSASKLRHMLID